MKILCSKCQQTLGLKEPFNDERETHGLCFPCMRLMYPASIVEKVIAAMEKTEVPESRMWEEPK